MTDRNKGKLKAADIIADMVQERLDEAKEEGLCSQQFVFAYERVLDDIGIYRMIIRKSDRYRPVLNQREPGCDY